MMRQVMVALVALTFLVAACSSGDEEINQERNGIGLLASGDVPSAGTDRPEATGTADADGDAAQTVRTIDDVYYEIARVVPGFAGIGFNDRNDGFLIWMAEEAEVADVRAGIIEVMRDEPSFAYAMEQYETFPMELVTVEYDWVQLYDWYQQFYSVGDVSGLVFSDIDEAQNRLSFGVQGDDPEPLARRLRDAGIPDDAFIIETGVKIGSDD
jgi:hypothetical protein